MDGGCIVVVQETRLASIVMKIFLICFSISCNEEQPLSSSNFFFAFDYNF